MSTRHGRGLRRKRPGDLAVAGAAVVIAVLTFVIAAITGSIVPAIIGMAVIVLAGIYAVVTFRSR